MGSVDEQILRATKEIVVKFIEAGRVSPTSFEESFKTIYNTIEKSVKGEKEKPETERTETKPKPKK
ncbi:MAG: conjugal transfer protein TraB [Deltaproteobacteria bacterium]|nr:conjugal transfer protein TraB [Deltaproteobacteria bacterium]MBW2100461.1 conjugal transfer protein TraB [Deltaproteobacteria bacterium]